MDAEKNRPGIWMQIAALAVMGIVCAATSMSPHAHRAAWRVVSEREKHFDSLDASAWVSKSGKTGTGVTLSFKNLLDSEVAVEVKRAVLSVAGEKVSAKGKLSIEKVKPDAVAHLYLPFVFDNERYWNELVKNGSLSIWLSVDGKALEAWTLRLRHEYREFDRKTRLGSPDGGGR